MSSLNNTEIHAAVHDLLHNAGQRYTDKRRAIIDILIQSGKPMLITDILAKAKDMPQSTLYRNLLVLEETSTVVRVVTNADSGCYELAEHLMGHDDLTAVHDGYVVYTACWRIHNRLHLVRHVDRMKRLMVQRVVQTHHVR